MAFEARHLFRLVPVLLAATAVLWWLATHEARRPERPEADGPDAFAGSAACRPCHAAIHAAWSSSHHALAEVPFRRERHGAAFEPERRVRHGTRESRVRLRGSGAQVVAEGADGVVAPYHVARVIGVDPMWQPVVAAPGGRYQVSSLAFDPEHDEWFDVFGDEDRGPDEWGFWANRGMTWNSMCASCHTTDFRKNYDPVADTYDSRYIELGVGCEACHGPYAAHVRAMERAGRHSDTDREGRSLVRWPPQAFLELPAGGAPPDLPARDRLDVITDTCGSCHARRVELTGRFRGGDRFLDHFRPVIPAETDVYYADGQVHEENYEYVSFLSSRMHAMGVRCIHCHEPHGGRLRAEGNELCLGCHRGKVDPAAHSHHDPAGAGGQCTACHMPQTVYMQRDARHDHGFTIPDPLLTRELGIPNACTRCHTAESTEWAIEWVDRWYGDRMERPTRERARAVARARRGEPRAARALLHLLRSEASALWRSVAAGLLEPDAVEDPAVQGALLSMLDAADPLERTAAATALEPLLGAPHAARERARTAREKLALLLADPVRAVRTAAAWTLRRDLDLTSPAGKDLVDYLALNSDQPAGAYQQGAFFYDRAQLDARHLEQSVAWLEKAALWDPSSPRIRAELAVAYSASERHRDAIRTLEEAVALAPKDAFLRFRLGQALGEAERLEDAMKSFELAANLDPGFARAWYNLALAQNQLGRAADALETLERAVALDTANPEFLWARATILAGLDRDREALETVRAAEELAPGSPVLIELRATLHSRLGEAQAAREAWEEYAGALRALEPADGF